MGLYESVEGVEKLLLGAVLVGKELDVIDQEQVERVVEALEFIKRLLLVGAHHVRDVLLGMRVAHLRLFALGGQMVADGLQQVSLSQSYAAIDEKRVVGNPGVLGDLDCGRAGELVCLSGNEAVEREIAVEPGTLVMRRRVVRDSGRTRGSPGGGTARRREDEPDFQLAPGRFGSKPPDPRRKAFANEIEDKAIRRGQHERAGLRSARSRRERADPRVELLRGQLGLEPAQAGIPEALHRGRGFGLLAGAPLSLLAETRRGLR